MDLGIDFINMYSLVNKFVHAINILCICSTNVIFYWVKKIVSLKAPFM